MFTGEDKETTTGKDFLYWRGIPIRFTNVDSFWGDPAEYLQTGPVVETKD